MGATDLNIVPNVSATSALLLLDPGSANTFNAPQTFKVNVATDTPVSVVAATGQTANLTEWRDSTGTVLARVSSAGEFFVGATKLGSSGGATSPMVLTSTDVAQVPLTIRGMASQTGNLTEWFDSAGTRRAHISPTGQGLFSGGVDTAQVSTGGTELVMQQTGDTMGTSRLRLQNRAGSNGAVFENVGERGSLGLVDFGFLSNGKQLNVRMESRNVSRYASTDAELQFGSAGNPGLVVSGSGTGPTMVRTTAAGVTSFVVKGAASQTADLQQWQDSAATVVAKVAVSGAITQSPATGGFANFLKVNGANVQSTTAINPGIDVFNDGTNVYGYNLGHGNSRFRNQAFFPAHADYGIGQYPTGAATGMPGNLLQRLLIAGNGPTTILPATAALPALVVKGAASQTANLTEWQDSAGTVIARVTNTGHVISGGSGGIGGARLVPGTNARSGYLQIDQANGTRAGYIGWSPSTGTTDGAGVIEYQANSHTFYTTGAGTVFVHGHGAVQTTTPHMWIGQSANVGADANPTAWIRMAGPGLRHGDFTFHPGEGGVFRFRYSESGNFQYHAPIYAGSYSNVSLLETKDHIETVQVTESKMTSPALRSATPTPEEITNESILDRFRKLRPVAYIQKGQHENPDILDQVQHSFVAEEAAEVLPEIISIDANGKPDGINLGAVGTLNSAMIQHLLDRVEALEAQIAEREAGS